MTINGKELEGRAGEIWRSTVCNRKRLSPSEFEDSIASLLAIASELDESGSLLFAAEQIRFLSLNKMPHALNVMGPAGCGKSSLAEQIAHVLKLDFADADNFHPLENKEKMRQNCPLDDQDRRPFLLGLREFLKGRFIITCCSALRSEYRAILAGGSIELLTSDACDDPWLPLPPTTGLITLMLSKPYEVALTELDFATKCCPRQIGNQAHFISVTRENPELLINQYKLLETSPLKPWEAIVIDTQDFRLRPIQESDVAAMYDNEAMTRAAITGLGY